MAGVLVDVKEKYRCTRVSAPSSGHAPRMDSPRSAAHATEGLLLLPDTQTHSARLHGLSCLADWLPWVGRRGGDDAEGTEGRARVLHSVRSSVCLYAGWRTSPSFVKTCVMLTPSTLFTGLYAVFTLTNRVLSLATSVLHLARGRRRAVPQAPLSPTVPSRPPPLLFTPIIPLLVLASTSPLWWTPLTACLSRATFRSSSSSSSWTMTARPTGSLWPSWTTPTCSSTRGR